MLYLLFFCGVSLFLGGKKNNLVWNLIYFSFFGFYFLGKLIGTGGGGFNQFYPLFMDNIGIYFILISIWVVLFSMLSGLSHVKFYMESYVGLYVIMFMLLILFFSVESFFFFFFLFESSLVPIFLVVGLWGAQMERIMANYYFMLYTLVGGFPFLAIVMMNFLMYEDSYYLWEFNSGMPCFMGGVLFCLMVAFVCKLPLYGFHLWLPKAHVEAPVGGSMVLAGLLLKMGGYGAIRVVLLSKIYASFFFFFLLGLSVVGGLFATLVCMRQSDVKSFIAYSSVSHMSVGLGGLLTGGLYGLKGSYLIFLGHGLISPLMFFVGNSVYERVGSRIFGGFSGMGLSYKGMAVFFFLVLLGNMGMPPFINFFGELSVYFSLIGYSFFLFIVLMLVMVLMGVVMLKVFSKLFRSQSVSNMRGEWDSREAFVLLGGMLMVIYMSVFLFLI
uniref:NADH-ubiquinone oxidoreductase chain 4 n=1 Tax=Pyura gangelion TaxID=569434 RepID=S0DGU6_PYUGA|nr:NADH dehydrogenase subunit 4 [Pyura gangelion]CCO25763.1 NADH dehydrogenase subunit 4 [Pyura gangelion]